MTKIKMDDTVQITYDTVLDVYCNGIMTGIVTALTHIGISDADAYDWGSRTLDAMRANEQAFDLAVHETIETLTGLDTGPKSSPLLVHGNDVKKEKH